MARILTEQFESVFTRDNHDVEDTRLPGPDLPGIPPLNITPQGVGITAQRSQPQESFRP